MRLIQVLHGWPPSEKGGTGLYVAALSRALMHLGHHVALAAPRRSRANGLREIDEPGLRGWHLAQRPAWSWRDGWLRSAGMDLWARLLEKEKPDLVHIHHLSGLPLGLVRATREAGVPVALTLHDYWIPCHRGQLVDHRGQPCPGPSPLGCARCASGKDRPGRLSRRRATERIAMATDALHAADLLWSPSEDLAERMVSMGLPRPELCPLPLVRPAAAPTDPGDGPVRFLFASSMIPTKGPHLLLQAFAPLSDGSTLTLTGHSPLYDGRRDYAEELQAAATAMPNVRWMGPTSPDQMSALMAAHDVLVLPSIWPENSPLVVREATAQGLRIIGSTEGGTGELTADATLVPPGDVEALRAALQAEVEQGRYRATRQAWQTPEDHARWILQRYSGGDDSQLRD